MNVFVFSFKMNHTMLIAWVVNSYSGSDKFIWCIYYILNNITISHEVSIKNSLIHANDKIIPAY